VTKALHVLSAVLITFLPQHPSKLMRSSPCVCNWRRNDWNRRWTYPLYGIDAP